MALLLLSVAGAAPAAAQVPAELRERCGGSGVEPAEQILACTALIESNRETVESRSIALSNRGIAWHTQRELDRAMADYDEAIRLNPRNANAFNNRGIAWRDRRELDRAMADYDEAIRLSPRDARPYHNRGNVWSDRGELKRALADYDRSLRLDPQEAYALANRCLVRLRLGEDRRALADCDAAVARMVRHRPWPLQARAGAYLLLEERTAAERDIEQGLRQLPADPWFLWLRALLREQRGMGEAAQRDRDAAGPVDAAARRSFGPHLLNGARVEGRLDPLRDHALPATLACRTQEQVEAFAAGARAGTGPNPPPGCVREGLVFRPERRLPLPSFPAEVVARESYGTRACERLSRLQEPCPLVRREAAAFEGWTRRASDGARERVFVVLDARIGLDVLEARIGPQRADGAMSRAPAAAAGAGSGAGPLAAAGPGPGLTGGIGGFGPSLMDALGADGYEVGLADRSPPWLLPPLIMPPSGIATPR